MLKVDGINTNVFKAHSIRSSLTSKAKPLDSPQKGFSGKAISQGSLPSKDFTIKKLGVKNNCFRNQYSKWIHLELRIELYRIW